MENKSTIGKVNTMREKKPLLFIGMILGIALILVLIAFLIFRFVVGGTQQSIATIETTTQQMGGASTTNYLPILADNVNWEKLTDKEREDIARYAVGLAMDQAVAEGVQSYNVLGMKPGDRKTVFLYTGGGEYITLYVGDDYVLLPM